MKENKQNIEIVNKVVMGKEREKKEMIVGRKREEMVKI